MKDCGSDVQEYTPLVIAAIAMFQHFHPSLFVESFAELIPPPTHNLSGRQQFGQTSHLASTALDHTSWLCV